MKSYIDYIIANENFEISINTDIFETNIINLIILLGILFVVIYFFLTENLTNRKKTYISDIENAETRLADSNKRYIEAQKQWSQMDIILKEINQQMETTKQNVLKLRWNQAKEDLSKKFIVAIEILRNRENKIFNDLIKEVSKKALTRVVLEVVPVTGVFFFRFHRSLFNVCPSFPTPVVVQKIHHPEHKLYAKAGQPHQSKLFHARPTLTHSRDLLLSVKFKREARRIQS